MTMKVGVSILIVVFVAVACTSAELPPFDTSSLAVAARAEAQEAISATQVVVSATQTAIANQVTTLELVQAADATNGEVLFNTFQADAGFACGTCHRVDTEDQLIGPGLLNVSLRGETRVEEQDAADYLLTSIINPDDFVVEPFSADLMPENWADIYTDEEIYDIIAYLFTLQGESTAQANDTSENVVDTEYPSELADSDATNGEVLFNTFQADAGFACGTCHWVDTENQLIGPGLLNVSQRAGSRVEGQSAYEYILTSITNPDAFVVEPFSADLMPENWAAIYTDEEINDIIAYLWTLNGE